MNGRVAKQLRRDNPVQKPKQFFEPKMYDIAGEMTYIPRKQRRALMRKFSTDIRKGRIDMKKVKEVLDSKKNTIVNT